MIGISGCGVNGLPSEEPASGVYGPPTEIDGPIEPVYGPPPADVEEPVPEVYGPPVQIEEPAPTVYGPPEYFDDPSSEHSGNPDESEKGSFLDKIIALFRKVIDFLKGLFS